MLQPAAMDEWSSWRNNSRPPPSRNGLRIMRKMGCCPFGSLLWIDVFFARVRERESEVLQITQVEPRLKMLNRGKIFENEILKLDGTVFQHNISLLSLHLGVSPFQRYCHE